MIGAIADYSGNNIPATSRIVDRMIDKDLIGRATGIRDHCSVRITLTAKSEALQHLSGFHKAVNERLIAGMSSEHADLLMGLLEQVEQNARHQ